MPDLPTTILVVDDEEPNRDVLSRRLERRGYAVLMAAGGQEAIDLIMSRRIDIVILDVMMPHMSGFEVLSIVRKAYPPNELPIVMATAQADQEDILEALRGGANDYITKPIDFEVLMARIEVHLRARSADRGDGWDEPVSSAEIVEGVVLDGNWRIGKTLGSGSCGTVHRAMDLQMEREVAIKVLRDSVARHPEVLARFRREAIATCRLRHPNAIHVLDSGATRGGIAYMVLELLEGESLDRLLAREGRLTPSRCAEVLIPVAGLLREVHATRMVHRDVKPSNIFLESVEGREIVKVLDFGLARLTEGQAGGGEMTTAAGVVPGSPAYMAPERIRAKAYDSASDIYSLGVCLYEMLEGRRPFVSGTGDPQEVALMQVRDTPPPFRACRGVIGPELERLVMDALAKAPGSRPTAEAFERRLATAAGRPELAPPRQTIEGTDE